ncbi:MAG: hypothetical protein IAE91_12135 [Ignavibacteriaceae bacterium]|nr:hypothetical protein [Ignavibacteriaceae bacterium]
MIKSLKTRFSFKNQVNILLIALILNLPVFSGCDNKTNENPEPKEPVTTTPKIDFAKYDLKYNDLALFLAGKEVSASSPLFEVTKNAIWQAHAKEIGEKWSYLEKERLDSLRMWKESEFGTWDDKAKTVFYPFGGPDFLFAYEFFPDANLFILQGLEPVYKLPDVLSFNDPNLKSYLEQLQGSLRVLIKGGYFITKEMMRDFNTGLLRGVVPVMLMFMAKTDNTVLDVQYITTDANGEFNMNPDAIKSANDVTGNIKGVKILFTDKKQETLKTVYYFSTDTQNESWAKRKSIQNLVLENQPAIFFTKAASYLLHGDNFGTLRSFILDNCEYVLQTDTGIPYRFFTKGGWDYTLYGTYTKPVSDFPYAFQNDISTAYKGAGVKYLPFGICYRWEKGSSNMMVATKQK